MSSALAIAAWLSQASSNVHASEPSGAARDGSVLLQRGQLNYQAGRYQEALQLLEQLWAQQQTYEIADLLGTVELKLQRYRPAAEHLTFGLRELPSGQSAQVAGGLRAKLAEAAAKVGALRIRSTVDGAKIQVDGRLVGVTPLRDDLFVEPGSYKVEAFAAGESLPARRLEIGRGETRELMLEFTRLAAQPNPAVSPFSGGAAPLAAPTGAEIIPPVGAQQLAAPAVAELAPRSDAPLYLGGTVSALALASGSVMLLWANDTANDARSAARGLATGTNGGLNACLAPTGATAQQCNRLSTLQQKQSTLHDYAVASFAIAGVAAVGSLVYYLLQPTSREVHLAASPSAHGFDVAVLGRF